MQVLNEFAAVAMRKLRMLLTEDTHLLGMRIAERHRLSIFDATIVAAALEVGCASLWSEDTQDGLKLERKLAIRNPFC